ncbi:MAG: hypothetical protein JSU81_11395 [Candidatus Coatesbacteria bacterium]|nr:MAG: hypothetical protein JSU81_11395 [Candidatus Coatesbacteria bacterium]
MKKAIVLITACALITAAAAWAANIPDALDKNVVRLGPLLTGAFERSSYEWWDEHGPHVERTTAGGGGAAFWAQYDSSWFGVEVRLSGVYVGNGFSATYVNWENEYNMYLIKGKFRPYITPAAGLGYLERGGRAEMRPVAAIYFGIRLNSVVSPFYMTFDGGYKYIDDWWHGIIRNRYFFSLTEAVALRAGVEFGADLDYRGTSRVAARLEAGPSFSF